MITIGFFGQLSDLIEREIRIDIPQGVNTVDDLRDHLTALYPAASEALNGDRLTFALGDRIVSGGKTIAGAQRVDFLPPVSGG